MQKYNVKNTELIRLYGDKALHSEEFKEGRKQIHHRYTTVANHTLYVTDTAIRFGRWAKKFPFLRIDEKVLIQASLCHDLGIIGRDKKFHSGLECYKCHSKESVLVAQRLYPDMDEKTLDAIACHMYPLTKKPPKSIEGCLLISADKFCSVAERAYLELHKNKRVSQP